MGEGGGETTQTTVFLIFSSVHTILKGKGQEGVLCTVNK